MSHHHIRGRKTVGAAAYGYAVVAGVGRDKSLLEAKFARQFAIQDAVERHAAAETEVALA